MQSTLSSLQKRWGARIDAAIRRQIREAKAPAELADMLQYQLGYVDADGHRTRGTSGKRFRPILCLLACEAAGGEPERAMPTAAAIELLHNFSLIHDDIEDHDPARRHRPTVWKVWGEPQAVNAGDSMFALAFEAVLESSDDAALAVALARRFERTARFLTHGQYLDMSFESRSEVSTAEYMQMIDLKTGSLIEFSLWSGALLARATETTADAMAEVGTELGRAFQIRDDIMGIWAQSSVTGKEEAKDVANRKKTLPVLYAREAATGTARATLETFYAGGDEAPDAVIEIMTRLGARHWSAEAARGHAEAARSAMARAELREPQRSQLAGLIAELAGQ